MQIFNHINTLYLPALAKALGYCYNFFWFEDAFKGWLFVLFNALFLSNSLYNIFEL